MAIIQIGNLSILDSFTSEKCYIFVKITDNSVGIGLSEEFSGDAEVYMQISECEKLIAMLENAIAAAKNNLSG